MKSTHQLSLPPPLRDALREVRARLSTEFSLSRMVLFGSVARRTEDEESDADLLIVLSVRPTCLERDRITNTILDLNLRYDTNLSEMIVDQDTWDTELAATLTIHTVIEEEGIQI